MDMIVGGGGERDRKIEVYPDAFIQWIISGVKYRVVPSADWIWSSCAYLEHSTMEVEVC